MKPKPRNVNGFVWWCGGEISCKMYNSNDDEVLGIDVISINRMHAA